MPEPIADVYAGVYEAAIKGTINAANKIPEANRFKQIAPGKSHPTWLLGHLTTTMNGVVNLWVLGGKSAFNTDYANKFLPDFAGGAPITQDKSFYPAWEQILADYKLAGDAVVARVRGLSGGDLSGGPLGNPPEQFKALLGDMPNSLRLFAQHDSHHRGQMAMLGALPS